ncbi:MAG: multidrug effflux MFS transporter [Sneathiella sp.]|nr:multidrug effflux MFS transporter [Sneathiella sp.]
MKPRLQTPSIGYVEQVILLALISSMIAFSIDAMLPALSYIERDLNVVHPNGRQYVIGMLFVGMAVGMLFYGPISDSTGRKGPIYVGFVIFLGGCLLSIFATDFSTMLFGRFMQGLGAAGPRVVSMALIRDQYAGRSMAKFMSLVMTVFILVPILAPGIGQLILFIADWRGIFVAMAGMAVIAMTWFMFRQRETLEKSKRVQFSLNRLMFASKEVFTHPTSLGYMILSGFIFSAFLSYLSTSQQIFQDQYGVGEMFPVYFGVLAIAIGGASLVNSALVMKLGMKNLIGKALWSLTILSILYLGYAFIMDGHPPLWTLMIFLLATFFCFGILFGNVNALAMEPVGHIAGVASALITSVSTLQSVIFGTLIAQAYNGTILPLIIGFSVLGMISLIVMYVTNTSSVSSS